MVRTWTKEFIYPEIKAYDWIVYLDVESRVSLINLNWRNLFDKGENAEGKFFWLDKTVLNRYCLRCDIRSFFLVYVYITT